MKAKTQERLSAIEKLLNELKTDIHEVATHSVSERTSKAKTPFSFEFFPTKTDEGQDKLLGVFDELNALNPKYFSVTYGAGGSTRERTLGIVKALIEKGSTPIAPHISCIGDTKSQIGELLDYYKALGVDRVVALRGDLPSGQVGYGELPYALDLV